MNKIPAGTVCLVIGHSCDFRWLGTTAVVGERYGTALELGHPLERDEIYQQVIESSNPNCVILSDEMAVYPRRWLFPLTDGEMLFDVPESIEVTA